VTERAAAGGRAAVRGRAARFERWRTRLSDTTAQLEADAARSLEETRFELRFQPRVDRKGDVVAVEAHVHWLDPTRGVLRSDVFLPRLAERPVGRDIARWAFAAACRQALAWERDRPRDETPVPVAIGVLRRDALDPEFGGFVAGALARTGVPAALVQLAVDPAGAEPTLLAFRLLELRDLGVGVTVDDVGPTFGDASGFLPADAIRIDRRWIGPVEEDRALAGALRCLVDRAHDRGLLVGAAGVDRDGQASALIDIGCDHLQGSCFGDPAPADDLGWNLEPEPDPPASTRYEIDPVSGLPRRPRGVRRRGQQADGVAAPVPAGAAVPTVRPAPA